MSGCLLYPSWIAGDVREFQRKEKNILANFKKFVAVGTGASAAARVQVKSVQGGCSARSETPSPRGPATT